MAQAGQPGIPLTCSGVFLFGLYEVVDAGEAITPIIFGYLVPDFVVSEISHQVNAPKMVVLPIAPRNRHVDDRQTIVVVVHLIGITTIVRKEATDDTALIVIVFGADDGFVLLAVRDCSILFLVDDMLAPILVYRAIRKVVMRLNDSDHNPFLRFVNVIDSVSAIVNKNPNLLSDDVNKISHILSFLITVQR
jgi:hypothetical protein